MGNSLWEKKETQFITNTEASCPPQTVSGTAHRTLTRLSPEGTQHLGLQSDGADSCSVFLLQLLPNFALRPFADFVSLVKCMLSQLLGMGQCLSSCHVQMGVLYPSVKSKQLQRGILSGTQ